MFAETGKERRRRCEPRQPPLFLWRRSASRGLRLSPSSSSTNIVHSRSQTPRSNRPETPLLTRPSNDDWSQFGHVASLQKFGPNVHVAVKFNGLHNIDVVRSTLSELLGLSDTNGSSGCIVLYGCISEE